MKTNRSLKLAGGITLVALLIAGGLFMINTMKGKKAGIHSAVASTPENGESEEDEERYDGPMERYMLEIYKTKDPATGTVPVERLWTAINQADEFKKQFNSGTAGRTEAVAWIERGPMSDVVGPSNGNSRGQAIGSAPNTSTSGRIRAVLIDASDATGNTVWCGGVAGGLWKTTDFLNASPTWTPVNDLFSNLAVSSICQSPANALHMYFATGEPTSNADAVLGAGIWRSLDGGGTWTQLASTNITAFQRTFKVICDASGNVYAALRGNGLRRSTDQGANWTTITPAAAVFTSCTDIEISSTGRLHTSIGYSTAAAQPVSQYFYTDIPATATSAAGWNTGAGLPAVAGTANRLELAVLGSVVYAAATNASNIPYGIYRSADGGVTWTKQNAIDLTNAQMANQGWYNLSLAVDPTDANDIMIGAFDAYRSTNGGSSVTRATFWVGNGDYVHADHHFVTYAFTGGENRILMASDGGLFLSRDDGATFIDRNVGLRIKQFYSGIMHPNSTTNPNYIIGGAQDNGTHQLNAAGLSNSVEVTGGDGAYVDISPALPTTHWGAYVFNRYRLSTNSGANWTGIDWTIAGPSDFGRFINPFVYDGTTNVLYGAGDLNIMHRITNANNTAADVSTLVTLTGLFQPSAFKLSPYTANRLYVGSGPGSFSASGGRLYAVNNANSIASGAVGDGNVTNLTGAGWAAAWYLNCINVGTSDNNLVATFTNYGISNVWVSTNGGAAWTAVDGNLPDVPVRWALFPPGDNTKLIIATEAGVYTTNLLNGAATVWLPSTGFPTVRTDMLQLRAMDNMIVAATHGRGMWTGNLLDVLPLNKLTLEGSLQSDGKALLHWTATDPTPDVKYRVQYSTDGIQFTQIAETGFDILTCKHNLLASVGYYRVMGVEPNRAPVYSNIVSVRSNVSPKDLFVSISPNLVQSSARVEINGATGEYNWQIIAIDGKLVRAGKGTSTPGATSLFTLNTESLRPGTYRLIVSNNRTVKSTAFIKQ